MNGSPEETTIGPGDLVAAGGNDSGTNFFGRTDWLSFTLAAVIALAVYLYTISPEVTLEWSGMYATGAMYGGVGPPPGFPVWTMYAWVFTKILPCSNIAWRVSVSSAVAGAMLCGVISLMVSRGSVTLLESIRGFRRLVPREESQLRLVCGVVAGLGFGFHGHFWNFAVTVESAALAWLMMSAVLCLLLRWAYAPRETSYLYAAAFLYGLTLTVRLSLAALAPALPFVMLFLSPSLGRDLLVVTAALLGVAVWGSKHGWLPGIIEGAAQFSGLSGTYLVLAIAYATASLFLVVKSRQLFTRWRTVTLVVILLVCGWSFYFYIVFASTTNPPVNWGYARTTEGFYHMVSRGQFERIYPMNPLDEPGRYWDGIWHYSVQTFHAMGWAYLIPATVPLFFLRRVRGRARGWLFGLIACFMALSLFTLAMLNPPPDMQSWGLMTFYFPASHLVLTIWSGYGLVFLGTIMARGRRPKVKTEG